MAFDVYVGTLTRYYRRDWENVAQKMSREQGYEYRRIVAGGEQGEPPSAEDIREGVTGWCRAMSAGLEPHGFGPITWEENDQQPYFTDRPSWDGYSGLLLLAAYDEHRELPFPRTLPEVWSDDPAFQLSEHSDSTTRYRSILWPSIWLPSEFPFVFEGPTLTSEEPSRIGSVFTLKKQLDDLHTRTKDLLPRLQTELGPVEENVEKVGFFGKLFGKKPEQKKFQGESFGKAAEWGLTSFRELAAKACEHRLPLLLDF